MTPLENLQIWLRTEGCDGIVVPSTDIFLSEFAPPSERRLEWLSGFTGSTGIAIVTPNKAALSRELARDLHSGRFLERETRGAHTGRMSIFVAQYD